MDKREEIKDLFKILAKEMDDPYGGSKSVEDIDYDWYVNETMKLVEP